MSVLNDVIEPHQLGQALGEQKVEELARQRGVPQPSCSMSLRVSFPPLSIALPHKARYQLQGRRWHDVEETERA